MIYHNRIIGKYVTLRSVTIADADFIIQIRNDKSRNAYIHPTSPSLELQKKWIIEQNEREGDYYFTICDSDNSTIGLISIYNVDYNEKQALLGRWISWGNAFQNTESIILIFDFAFNELQIESVNIDVVMENKKIINFWNRFGAKHSGEVYDGEIVLDRSIVSRNDYINQLRDRNIRFLRY